MIMASPDDLDRLQREQDRDVGLFGIFCFILLLIGLFLCPIIAYVK